MENKKLATNRDIFLDFINTTYGLNKDENILIEGAANYFEEFMKSPPPVSGEKGYRWVKASKRPPIRRNDSTVELTASNIPFKVDSKNCTGYFSSYNNKIMLSYSSVQSSNVSSSGWLFENDFDRVEWLEEVSLPVKDDEDDGADNDKWARNNVPQ